MRLFRIPQNGLARGGVIILLALLLQCSVVCISLLLHIDKPDISLGDGSGKQETIAPDGDEQAANANEIPNGKVRSMEGTKSLKGSKEKFNTEVSR